MRPRPLADLRRLETLLREYGGEFARRKRAHLERLERRSLKRADEVLRLHECLCFLRAYPDDRPTLDLVERMLAGFARRPDLRRYRERLAGTGIAGTPIEFRFYWRMARFLVERWPARIRVDWAGLEHAGRLGEMLALLAAYSETPAFDEHERSPEEWLRRMRGPHETDAACLVRLFAGIEASDFWRERLFEEIDTPFRLEAGPTTPSRTRARFERSPVVFRTAPLARRRPELQAEIERRPFRIRQLSPAASRRIVDLAREALVTRSRDLDVFANADARDVRIVECGSGLELACIGVRPERRLLLEAVYGMLMLQNGVPIGYSLASALFGSSEIAFNVFDTFRGAEAGQVFACVLRTARQLFGSDTFCIDPFQLGHDNAEGLGSGAWWFYYKQGFRPKDARVRRIVRDELQKMHANPRHRSSVATLRTLVVDEMYWHAGRKRADVLGRLSPGAVGDRITAYLARIAGGDRRRALRLCVREARTRLGARTERLARDERIAWERFSPLVCLLPDVERWSRAERRDLVRLIRAKGGRRESDYVRLFDRHARFRSAVRVWSRRRNRINSLR
jgi:hypothetical protein